MTRLRGSLVQRALEEYKRPNRFAATGGGASGDIAQLTRRQALLEHVTSVDNDVLDQLHATREDLMRQRARRRARACARRGASESRRGATARNW